MQLSEMSGAGRVNISKFPVFSWFSTNKQSSSIKQGIKDLLVSPYIKATVRILTLIRGKI